MSDDDDDYPRPSRLATVEDDDDDDDERVDTIAPELSTSANVAAKRTKPELGKKGSYERKRSDGNDSGYASRAATVASRSPPWREKISDDLNIDPIYHKRESRPYSYSAPKERPPRPSSRPPIDRTDSEQSRTASAYRHEEGECWICDKYGKHIEPPQSNVPPPLPKPTRRPQLEEDYEEADVIETRPRPRRTSSYRAARPMTMYADPSPKMIYPALTPLNTYAHEAPSYSSASWQPAYSTAVQYAPVQYASYATVPLSPKKPPPPSQTAYTYATITESRSRPLPPDRRLSMHSNLERPVIKHRATTSDTSSYNKKAADPAPRYYDDRPPLLRTHKSSRDEDQDRDRQAMPPPPTRPPMKKAATSTALLNRRSSMSHELPTYTEAVQPRSPVRERAPPSSYKGPIQPSSSSPISPRGNKTERYEAEAEAYQRSHSNSTSDPSRSSKRNSLTAETLSKVPSKALPQPPPPQQRSSDETDSSQRSRYTRGSSRGSVGGGGGVSSSSISSSKNGSDNITMTINGIALTIPKVGEGQRVTVRGKGLDISVGGGKDRDKDGREVDTRDRDREKTYAASSGSGGGARERERERAPSVASRTSRTSNSSTKEITRGREREGQQRPLSVVRRESSTASKRYSVRMEDEGGGFPGYGA